MTTDPGSDGITARYIREEIAGLRTGMREDNLAVRVSVDALAAELRSTVGAWAPRIAVLERRADDHAADLGELRTHTTRVSELERKAAGYERDIATLTERIATTARNRSTLIITLTVGLIIAVVAAVLSWIVPG